MHLTPRMTAEAEVARPPSGTCTLERAYTTRTLYNRIRSLTMPKPQRRTLMETAPNVRQIPYASYRNNRRPLP